MTPTCYGHVALHFNASRKACFALAVSDLALIILAEIAGSFAHEGINPQGTIDNSQTICFRRESREIMADRMGLSNWTAASFRTCCRRPVVY